MLPFLLPLLSILSLTASQECFKPPGKNLCSSGKARTLNNVEVLWVEESDSEGFPVLRNIKTREAVTIPTGGNTSDPVFIATLLGAPHSEGSRIVKRQSDGSVVISEQGDARPVSLQIQEGTNPRRPAGPLPTCFFNKSGFSCCNRRLNDRVESTLEGMMRDQAYSPCNVHKMSRTISGALRATPGWENQDFEIMASLGDFAQTVHFSGDLACKIGFDNKYFLVYGTPKFDSAGVAVTKLRA